MPPPCLQAKQKIQEVYDAVCEAVYNDFDIILTRLSTLSPSNAVAHSAVSRGLLQYAARFSKGKFYFPLDFPC